MSDTRRHPISRRTFLRGVGAVTAVGAATAVGLRVRSAREDHPWDASAFPPPADARVAALRASSYDADLEAVVLAGLRAIEADVSGARILLKPNFVEFDAGSAINTDPRLIAAAVGAFRRLGAATVVVGEAPGHRRDTRYVVEASGLAEALRDVQAPFVDMNVSAAALVALHSHYTGLGSLWLPTAVTEADVVVSMPKMKTHHWAGVTLSLKNCFGCLPGRVYGWPKNVLHWQGIERSILDIAGAVRPSYAIVDGIVAMEGNGPIDGTPKPAGLVIVGNDPVAVDATTAHIMGFEPDRLPYLAEAGAFLGVADLERISVRGEDPDALVTPFAPAPGFEGIGATAVGGQ
jgi:uncharacterized protein (DUF362 family)